MKFRGLSTVSKGVIFTLLLVGLPGLLIAQQAAYYPAIPWTRDVGKLAPADGNNAHPNTPPPIVGGCAGLFAAPQAVTVGRTLFDPDSGEVTTSDAVAVPAHYADDGSRPSAYCYGDIVSLLFSSEVVACQNQICKAGCEAADEPGYPLPAKNKTCNDMLTDPAQIDQPNEDWMSDFCEDYARTTSGREQCKTFCMNPPALAAGQVLPPLPAGKVCADIDNIDSMGIVDKMHMNNYCEEWLAKTTPGLTLCKADCSTQNASCADITDAAPHPWAIKYCVGTAIALGEEWLNGMSACFKDHFPESCKAVKSPVLVTDGDRDPGDVNLEDNWPAPPVNPNLIAGLTPESETLIAGLIPDPVDSFFPTTTHATSLLLPVDVTKANFNADTPQIETAVLNYFPLDKTFFDTFSGLAGGNLDDKLKFIVSFAPIPYPGFLTIPEYQKEGVLFTVMDQFQGGIQNHDNLENESTTDDVNDPKSYKNVRSSPVAIRAVPVSGPGTNDIVILHQNFSSPSKPIDPLPAPPAAGADPNDIELWKLLIGLDQLMKQLKVFGQKFVEWINPDDITAEDYCSNFGNNIFPGKDLANGSSLPINLGFMNMQINFAGGKTLFDLQIKTISEHKTLSYLTWHKNMGGLDFKKQPSKEKPYRLCVGKAATQAVVANIDGTKDGENIVKNDLVISESGGLTPTWDPTSFSAMLEVSGGITFVRNATFAGPIGAEQILHLPIGPDLGQKHIQHYNDVACGDVDGDGDDDCIATGSDGMGLSVHVGVNNWYRVPDVLVATPKHNNGDPNANALGIGNNGDCTFTLPDAGLVKCKHLENFADDAWTCQKKADKNVGGNPVLDNPANPEDAILAEKKDLYECRGMSLDKTCPEFKRENAKKFLYYVEYNLKGDAQHLAMTKKQILEAFVAGHNFPVAGANCVVDDVNISPSHMVCTNIPNFDGWACTARGMPNDQSFNMDCKALTIDTSPAVGQFPDIFGEADDLTADIFDPAAGWEAVVKNDKPVVRDALYTCGYDFNINRNSEFAVYMNPGSGQPGDPKNGQFNTVYPNLHHVDMAQVQVPRIVPDFPLSFELSSIFETIIEAIKNILDGLGAFAGGCGAIPNMPGVPAGAGAILAGGGDLPSIPGLNTTDEDLFNQIMGERFNLSAKGNGPNNTIGLGVWPFDVELAHLVDKTGAPKPDECADAVVALNNSHYVALIASQCGWEPFKGAPTLYFDASTPEFKTDLAKFTEAAINKIKIGQKLSALEYLSLLAGLMSGTSRVVVPENPINGLNEFSQPDARLGIVAIHAFPWRLIGTWINSFEVPGGIGAGGGGGAGGCAAPAGGGGGCSLIMEGMRPKP